MANTYTQIHIQCVFAVKFRQALLHKEWRGRMFQYMIGILNYLGHRPLAVNGIEDHVHLFFGLKPEKSISESMKMVKGESSRWINENRFCGSHFEWQGGYGAFSYRKSDVPQIARYIERQEEHHRKKTFIQEYKGLLKEFDVEFDERYILMPPI